MLTDTRGARGVGAGGGGERHVGADPRYKTTCFGRGKGGGVLEARGDLGEGESEGAIYTSTQSEWSSLGERQPWVIGKYELQVAAGPAGRGHNR